MLHEIISKKKTGTNNGSKGVMNYMLKEKDGSPRKGATVLRGDVETQAKLIDSLVGKFKQQYVTGCFSFEESPDEVTEEQKNELMDMAEEAICAGLSPDRISITWIEHTDKVHEKTGKPRLELNYIVAQVDLEHGRLFQPYVHSHDKDRFNALCTIQNIKHGYTEPNDPAKAQNVKEPSGLPKKEKELKAVITEHIESLVELGLVNNRDDVKKALQDLDFKIARQSATSISVKRPDGGRNLKFKSKKDGLYGIDFRPSATSEAEIRRASEDYRASAPKRFRKAQEVYERELERKRSYHQKRHSKPRRNQPRIAKPVNPALTRLTPFNRGYALTIPNPFTSTLKRRKERDKELITELQQRDRERNRQLQEQARKLHSADAERHREQTRELTDFTKERENSLDMGSNSAIHNLASGFDDRRINSEINQQTINPDLSEKPDYQRGSVFGRSSINDDLQRTLDDEQRATRPSTASAREPATDNRATEADNSNSKSVFTESRERNQSVDSLIEQISADSKRITSSIAESVQELEKLDKGFSERVSSVAKKSEVICGNTAYFSKRIGITSEQSNSANQDNESISERVTKAGQLRSEITRYTEQNRQLKKSFDGNTEQYRQLKKSFDENTERNREANRNGEQVVEWLGEETERVQQAIDIKQEAKQQAENSRSYRPRPF